MPLSPLRVLLIALALRLLAALLSTAFFQPDEYWQNLEPAYHLVFSHHSPSHTTYSSVGTGRTWEWRTAPDAPLLGGEGWASWEVLDRLVKEGGFGGIRSPLSVLPTAGVYSGLKQLNWVNPQTLFLAPRLVQALFAASTDLALFLLARRVLGSRYTSAALFASLTSFFHFYTLSRTFSNSTEATLTTWALVLWLWPSSPSSASMPSKKRFIAALALAATATLMRPSNAVIWTALGAQLLWRRRSWRARRQVIGSALLVGLLASLLSLILDSLFYSTPTFTPLRFLHFNLVQRVSHFYGTSSAAYYLVQGVPLLLLTQLPFFMDGFRRSFLSRVNGSVTNPGALRELRWTLAATTTVYSMLDHKEWRFLHPLLPVMHLFVALSLTSLSSPSSTPTSSPSSTPTSSPSSRERQMVPGISRLTTRHLFLLLLSLLPAIYLSTFHGVGQNTVMHYLSRVLREERAAFTSAIASPDRGEEGGGGGGGGSTVGFLMPCHSTGWMAFLNAPWLEEENIEEGDGQRLWYLTCEPPVLGQDPSLYLDQSDYFYRSPSQYLLQRFPRTVDLSFRPSPPLPLTPPHLDLEGEEDKYDLGWTHAWPLRLVLFSNLLAVPCTSPTGLETVGECGEEGTVGGLLWKKGYREEKRFWNAIGGWNEDERRRGEVVVLRWRGGEGGRIEDGWVQRKGSRGGGRKEEL
ncbi:hypothetical protein JCM11251_000044 [Rhodosporidiobolus azoricus]